MFFRRKGLPAEWEAIVEARVGHWQYLDANERALLAGDTDYLLRKKYWEAANGFEIDDEIRVTIAAQAALLVLGRSVDDYRMVTTVIVFPTTIQAGGVRAGAIPGTVTDEIVPVLGDAHDLRGPVRIAWDTALRDARHPERGHNVVFHEFAHKLDMEDGTIDGTPRLDGRDATAAWIAVCTEVFGALRRGEERPPLRAYGATNPGEFFAVATEAFFDVPRALRAAEPDLYEVLQRFYRQDPAARVPA